MNCSSSRLSSCMSGCACTSVQNGISRECIIGTEGQGGTENFVSVNQCIGLKDSSLRGIVQWQRRSDNREGGKNSSEKDGDTHSEILMRLQ